MPSCGPSLLPAVPTASSGFRRHPLRRRWPAVGAAAARGFAQGQPPRLRGSPPQAWHLQLEPASDGHCVSHGRPAQRLCNVETCQLPTWSAVGCDVGLVSPSSAAVLAAREVAAVGSGRIAPVGAGAAFGENRAKLTEPAEWPGAECARTQLRPAEQKYLQQSAEIVQQLAHRWSAEVPATQTPAAAALPLNELHPRVLCCWLLRAAAKMCTSHHRPVTQPAPHDTASVSCLWGVIGDYKTCFAKGAVAAEAA